jgi:hypothetical protein
MQSGFSKPLRGLAAAGLLFFAAVPGHATSIGLTPVYPDLTTSAATLNYSYTAVCQNGSGSSIGSCGSGGRSIARWDLSYGVLTLTKDGSQTLNPYGAGILPVSNTTGLNYNLKVVIGFGAGGTSISGILANNAYYSGYTAHSSSLSATGITPDPNFDSGTIVSGTPTSAVPYGYSAPFGYSGTGVAGVFEFVFNNVGGDMDPYAGADWGGIIISTFNMTGTAGGWDAAGVNFWKTAHTGTANIDTFVPVPGAVWLFGSALACLGWIRQRAARVVG